MNTRISLERSLKIVSGGQTGADRAALDWAIANIALRKQIRTVFKCGIDTIMKAVKFVPSLPPPVFEYKPPMLYLI